MNEEKTIDALITETLPQHLQQMDRYVIMFKNREISKLFLTRSFEAISIGKSSLQTAFSEKENKQFLEHQKARLK